jgi:hypothetical protein
LDSDEKMDDDDVNQPSNQTEESDEKDHINDTDTEIFRDHEGLLD